MRTRRISSAGSMTIRCSPAWFARCDTAASKMSSMSSEFKVSLTVPSSKCVMVSRFSTISMSQSESWYTSSRSARRCPGARRPESSRRIAAAPEIAVSGVRRSWPSERNRFARSCSLRASTAASSRSRASRSRASSSAHSPMIERAMESSNESMSRSAARMPTTPNTSSCVRTGRNKPSPKGMATISEASAFAGGAEAGAAPAEAASLASLEDRSARNAFTRAFSAIAAGIASSSPLRTSGEPRPSPSAG